MTFFSQEDDILDMLAECEAEERDGKMFIGPQGQVTGQGRSIRGPKVSKTYRKDPFCMAQYGCPCIVDCLKTNNNA